MLVRINKLGQLLVNLMYKDTMTVKRKGSSTRNADGSNSSKLLDSFLQNEPCLVCETTNDSSRDDNMDVARQEVTIKVFCSHKLNVLRGDFLILSVKDDEGQIKKTIQGYAAQPCHFPDHLEIELYDWTVK